MNAQEIISSLISINSIKIDIKNPYKWASGWNSPIYCDNRISLSYPEIRNKITQKLVYEIKSNFDNIDTIAGVATAGIPQGALIAKELDLPFIYVRSSAKKHGLQNLIEGDLSPNSKVLIIEDLISTGGSSLKTIDAIKNRNCEIIGLLCVFNYNFKISEKLFDSNKIRVLSLCTYDDLITVAKKRKLINSEEIQNLEDWRKAPDKWSP